MDSEQFVTSCVTEWYDGLYEIDLRNEPEVRKELKAYIEKLDREEGTDG